MRYNLLFIAFCIFNLGVAMFTLALRKKFIAHHHAAAEIDAEHPMRSHMYILEVMLETDELDSEGVVLDLETLEAEVDEILAQYAHRNLNETEAFRDRIPTLERFAQVLGDALNETLYAPNLTALSVRLWRDEKAWALYDIEK
jgi:6-pyruvoyltetrahydropterin/6-carboxytetrahydropterin synthase